MGVAADRGLPVYGATGPSASGCSWWPTAGLLTVFSAWRLSRPSEIVAPVLIVSVGSIILASAYATRKQRSGERRPSNAGPPFPREDSGCFRWPPASWALLVASSRLWPMPLTLPQRRLRPPHETRCSDSPTSSDIMGRPVGSGGSGSRFGFALGGTGSSAFARDPGRLGATFRVHRRCSVHRIRTSSAQRQRGYRS